jgi:hypothetical protein
VPVEAKPLFRPDVLQSYLAAFTLPERVQAHRPALARLAELFALGQADPGRVRKGTGLPFFGHFRAGKLVQRKILINLFAN